MPTPETPSVKVEPVSPPPAIPGGGGLGGAIPTPVPTPGISPERLTELATVKAGQGFWQPIQAQVAAAHPDWTKAQLNKETMRLLTENGIIKPDGSELRVSRPGVRVFLNPNNTITFDNSQTYTHTPTPVVEQVVAPQGLGPNDPQVTAYASQAVDKQMGELFGSRGFWGIGARPWNESPDMVGWGGFAGESVADILAAHPSNVFPEDGVVQLHGIKEHFATEKAKEYLAKILKETGVAHKTGEKFLDYVKRATAEGIARAMTRT